MKNVVLIGMRASGKSVIGKLLAKRFKVPHFDTDKVIVEQAGTKIANIVSDKGWEYFRQQETEACRKVSQKQGVIISTGGGVVLREENMQLLQQNGFVFFLDVPIEVLVARLNKSKQNKNRPSLTGQSIAEELEEVWQEREELYRDYADATFYLTGGSHGKLLQEARTIEKSIRRNKLLGLADKRSGQ
jgi:shikimate kinase